jgi:hypothetical protein
VNLASQTSAVLQPARILSLTSHPCLQALNLQSCNATYVKCAEDRFHWPFSRTSGPPRHIDIIAKRRCRRRPINTPNYPRCAMNLGTSSHTSVCSACYPRKTLRIQTKRLDVRYLLLGPTMSTLPILPSPHMWGRRDADQVIELGKGSFCHGELVDMFTQVQKSYI